MVAGLLQVRDAWFPGGDLALTELFVRQVPRHVISTGPYSAFRGFSHPLPYGFYAVWAPYEILGRRSAALLTGTMWFNGAVLAGTAWILVRRGKAALAVLVVAAVGIVVRVDTPSLLLVPWNPYLAALPFLGLLVVAPFVWRGERWLAPVAVALASWSAGLHLLFAPSAVVIVVVALGGLGFTAWRRRGVEPVRRLAAPVGASLGVAVAMWLPALVDLARRGTDGNTGHIARFMANSGQASLPLHDVLVVATSELAWRPTWTGGSLTYPLGLGATRFPLFLLLGGIAAFGAWRRRRGWELTALGFGILSIVVAAYTFGRNSGLIGDWYLLPLRLSAVWFTCVTLYSLGGGVVSLLGRWRARPRARWSRPLPTAVPLAATAVLWLGVVVLAAWPGPRPAPMTVDPPPDLAALEKALPGHPAVEAGVLLRSSAMPVGYLLALDRAGYDVHVPRSQAWHFGQWRARPAPDGSPRLLVAQEPAPSPAPRAGSHVILETGPRPQLFGPDLPVRIWRLPPAG